jgi:hypothetical protein
MAVFASMPIAALRKGVNADLRAIIGKDRIRLNICAGTMTNGPDPDLDPTLDRRRNHYDRVGTCRIDALPMVRPPVGPPSGTLQPVSPEVADGGQGPVSAIVVIVVSGLALPGAQFPAPVTVAVGHALLVAFVLSLGWAAAIALDLGAELYLRRFHTDVEDNLLVRKHLTQVRVLQRVAKTVLVIFTVAALTTIDEVRHYGVSLFASAGAARIILGLAARPVLGNLLAGIQIAMTQPIRVEDQVIVEGECGWIETITSTYVVVRIWDLRRMIVPLTYFIEKPFQNWTYENAEQIGSVLLHVDYTVPVDRLRQKLDQIVHESKLWDGKVAVLQVTDTPDSMVE